MQTAPEPTTAAEPKKEKKKKTVGQEVLSWILSLVVALAAAMLIRTFLFTLITVSGTSMLDTLLNGDKLYVSVLSANIQGYEHGDIVICQYPGRTDYIVKRVIGLPGDTVMVDRGQVYVNGEALEEDYVVYPNPYSYHEITLGEGEYFVLGDNRSVSHDSHSSDVGPVTRIIGKVRAIFWPLNRIGAVK
ncbi:MAG: signal peptidase I [Clostridia bacterium]|nr:signal peptidase I [Clostridia bacterium]MBR4442743.1 signal peptidase I [Clostridia bacterium]